MLEVQQKRHKKSTSASQDHQSPAAVTLRAPPHMEAGGDPDDHRHLNEVDDHRPQIPEKSGLLESTPRMNLFEQLTPVQPTSCCDQPSGYGIPSDPGIGQEPVLSYNNGDA